MNLVSNQFISLFNNATRPLSMKFLQLTLLFCFFSLKTTYASCAENTKYEFYGRHFMAQYYQCNTKALNNPKRLAEVMKEASLASGAHILKSAEYTFSSKGLTLVLLLSESHASIHTYPEHKACFVDFFTCGHQCSAEKFDAILRAYLLPKHVKSSLQERS